MWCVVCVVCVVCVWVVVFSLNCKTFTYIYISYINAHSEDLYSCTHLTVMEVAGPYDRSSATFSFSISATTCGTVVDIQQMILTDVN